MLTVIVLLLAHGAFAQYSSVDWCNIFMSIL